VASDAGMLTSVKMEEQCGGWAGYSSLLEDTFAQVEEILGSTNMAQELQYREQELEYGREQEVQTTIKEEPLEEEQEEEEGREDFTPLQRSRCNTWPRRGMAGGVVVKEEGLPLVCEEDGKEDEEVGGSELLPSLLTLPKTSARRNPWGNYSYAELITQAITKSGEGRLTLAQIYDWMIANVPYFGQRSDSTSSAGWKNSIRHNLSLHQRFLKVQNEGAGKSSWWTLNPERKLGAKPRRRATSGDVKSVQSKRVKARRKAESFRAGGRLVRTSSTNGLPPSSPSSDSLPDSFRPRSKSSASLDSSYFSFRPRTHSNASSVSQTSPRARLESLDGMDQGGDDLLPGLPDFSLLTGEDSVLGSEGSSGPAADLDSITLDDLSLGNSGPNIGDPALIIQEYLHPSDNNLHHSDNHLYHSEHHFHPSDRLNRPARDHRLKILEPREDTVGRSVIKHTNTELLPSTSNSNLCFTANPFLTSLACRTRHDEARKDMIRKRLDSLQQQRQDVQDSQRNISHDNRKSLESAIDLQIKLLQEGLDKLSRQEENSQGDFMDMDTSSETLEGDLSCEDSMPFGFPASDLHSETGFSPGGGPPPAEQYQQRQFSPLQGRDPSLSEFILHSRRAPEVVSSCI